MLKNREQNKESGLTSFLNYALNIFHRAFFVSQRTALRGDTLVEVMFAVAVFGLGAVGAIALMNTGLASVQNSLETTLARQEIDAQAEALRFIHDAYLTEPDTKQTDTNGETVTTNNFRNLWKTIVSSAYPASSVDTAGNYSGGVATEDPKFFTRTVDNKSNCDSLFTTATSNGSFGIPKQSFVINPRGLNLLTEKVTDSSGNAVTRVLTDTDIRQNIFISADSAISDATFGITATFPRLLYGTNNANGESLSDAFVENNALKYKNAVTRLDSAEGIWVTAITSKSGLQCYDENGSPEGSIRPDFYDFHIQTCWDSVGGSASVISSTVRLFNPDQVNLKKQGMITFDNVEWEKYSNTEHTGETCGQEVCADCHVEASGTEIVFTGYTRDAMDEGVRLSIADRLYFTLDVDVDTSGILTHPGGEGLTIIIGPIKANLTDSGGSITGTETKSVNSRTFHLKMTRAGNNYTACAGEVCVEATSDATDVSIDYNFKHTGHCCDAISRAKLSNIEMTSTSIEDESASGCVRITPAPTTDDGIIPLDGDTSGPGTQPSEQNPPAQEEVEETIIASTGSSLQYFDIKFDAPGFSRIGVRKGSSRMTFPSVGQVASGANIDEGACSVEFYSDILLHCMYPSSRTSSGYSTGTFVIYLDRDSLTDDSNATYFGSGPAINDFWSQNIKATIYFYDRIMYFSDTLNHEDQLAKYKISSDTVRTIDNNGRYWIIGRVHGNPSSNYWAEKLEIINQRTNRSPSTYL